MNHNRRLSVKIKLFCKNLGIIVLTNLLMGCAGPRADDDAILAQNTPDSSAESAIYSRPLPSNLVPFGSLQQEYMYKILVAEVAKLRGDHGLSAQYFLDVAEQTRDPRFAENATITAWQAQNYQLALEAARLWVSLDPDNSRARQILSQILLRQKRTEEAVGYLETVIENVKDDPQQMLSVMEAMLGQTNQTKALELIEQVIAKQQNDPVMLWTYSRLLVHANQLDKAMDVLRTLLSLVPDHDQAVPLYAILLEKQDQGEQQALQWMGEALHKYPAQQEWRLVYAQMLADAQQFEQSIKQFQQLLPEYPEKGTILYALGVLSLETKQLLAAKEYFIQLIKMEQRLNNAQFYLGQIAQQEKDLENALNWYYQVKEDKDASIYLNAQAQIALILAEQGQLDKAIQHLRSVPVSREEDALNLIQLEADLLIDQKSYQQALDAYDRALKLKPDNVNVLYMRALLAEKIGLWRQLEEDLRRVLVIDPKNVNALNALGYSIADNTEYFQTERLQDAYQLIKQALALRPDDYYILDSMGWVLYKMGNYAQAIAYLRKALSKQEDPEMAAHLGEVLWVNGDRPAAIRVWEKALEAFPEDEKLRKVMNRFLPSEEGKEEEPSKEE